VAAPAAPPQAETPRDPLGRDTPRGLLLGFMRIAREGNDEAAPQYLNTPLRGRPAQELARQLYVVLDNRLPARLGEVSDRPEGDLANPLRPDEDIIATIATSTGSLDIMVERIRPAGDPPIWLFSRRTLAAIPDAYDEVDLISLDQHLPAFLVKPRIAGIRLFHWLVLLVIVPIVYRTMGALTRVWLPAARRLGLGRLVPAGVSPQRLSGAIRFIAIALVIRWLISTSDLPLVERRFWTALSVLFTIGSAAWLLLHVNASIERYLRNKLQWSGRTDIASLVRVARWGGDALVVLVAVLVIIRRLGGDPTAALAGLGIGGIAVALAAQKTLENVIGGLSLIFDRAVCVGDFLKIGEASGTVDSIGLRSTRIRTLDRTILSVPNGQIANASIETISARDMFWFRHVIGLRYETTPRQMRAVVGGIVRQLAGHAGVDPASVRARFLRFSASSLDIEMVAYIVAKDWPHFLEIQEELLLAVMEVVEQAGTAIAFPTQTLHVAESSRLAAALQPAGRLADGA
jgi:MscS family membrane protein